MDEKALKAAIKTQITNASGYLGGEITEARTKAMRDYLGEPMGNEIEGRSQVISTDVQDVVESVMPDIVQIFTSSDKAVRYEPVGPEDEQKAAQATDWGNHVWNVDNNGFTIFHDWFKDALLQKNGIIKIWWDDSKKVERRQYTGMSSDGLALMMQEDGVKVIEHDEYWSDEAEQFAKQNGLNLDDTSSMPPEFVAQGTLHDITIKRTKKANRVRIENVPPEEFLITRRARSLDDAPFMAHRTSQTQSDLIEQGYDPEQIKEIPTGDNNFYGLEKTVRFSDEESLSEQEADRSTREIDVYECFLRVDWDGDDIAEMRKVVVAGPAFEILKFKGGELDNEAVYDHPFSAVTPIRMPHKFFGRSLAEIVQDIQYIKTSIWRQTLDNMWNINNARAAISNKVSLDDYLDNKVGAPVRVDTDQPNAGGHIFPIQTSPIGNHAYPLLEYVDTVRETRTGINRLSQGLDPDALKNTATGINQLLGRSQQRMLLIAQVFASGVRDAFKKILRLSIEHQDKARTIRLRNQWVDIDPRSWNAEMDVTVDVGLGRGTKDQQVVTTSKVVEATMALVTLQSGVAGPFVYAHHVRNAYAKFYEAVGIKSSDPFLADITEEQSKQIAQQAQQAPPPPEIMLEQMKAQNQAADAQRQQALTDQKATQEFQLATAAHQRDLEKIAAETNLEKMKLGGREFEVSSKARERALDIETKNHEVAVEQNKAAIRLQAEQESTQIMLGGLAAKAKLERDTAEHKSNVSVSADQEKADIKRGKKKPKPGQPQPATVDDVLKGLADHQQQTGKILADVVDHLRKPKRAKKGADGAWQIEAV